jgi:simple sugar transport system permease protein
MSDTAERATEALSPLPSPATARGMVATRLRRFGIVLGQQREATVFVVVLALVVYFGFISGIGRATFFTQVNLVNLGQIAAPIIIIAIGEVFLLICGEIDLSPGFVYLFAPFLMYYLIAYYHFPAIVAMIVCLLMGVFTGFVNGFLTVTLGLPSFVATLGTGFLLYGITETTSNNTQASIPPSANWLGGFLGTDNWSEITWAIVLVLIFHVVLTRTKWGLHTIAVGGNQLGAREAGIHVARVKYGNFMLTGMLGALVGLQIAFQTSVIDPSAGGYTPMFSSVTAAVIGGTAMLGGSGTVIGAFLAAMMLAVLTNGFGVIGISANPLQTIFGATILVAMIVNVQLARLRATGRR